jgi:hypothetical protein
VSARSFSVSPTVGFFIGASVFVAGCELGNARGGSKETDEETLDRTDRRPAPLAHEYQRPAELQHGAFALQVRPFMRKLLRRLGFSCAADARSRLDARQPAIVASRSVGSRHI